MRQARYPVVWFFAFTYVLTAVGQSVNLYVMHRLSAGATGGPIEDSPVFAWRPYGFYITNMGPTVVGLLMTLYLYGIPGVRRLFAKLIPWSVGRTWPVLLVCLFLPLLVVLLSVTILSSLGLSDPPSPRSWRLSSYIVGAIIGGFLGPGICEELGWRGFALPHLQRRYSALVSSLIIGVAWALWHWPNYFIASIHSQPFWAFLAAIPMGIVASILYTWAYNSTGGSLFAVVVLHGATVATPSILGSAGPAPLVVPSLYAMIAIGLVWRYGIANLSWHEKVVADPANER